MPLSTTEMDNLDREFDRLAKTIEKSKSGSAEFLAAFTKLRDLADLGYLKACGLLAELQALEPSIRDPEAAYKWYRIALGREGFSVNYQNEYGSDESYLGPTGDFRNEGMVSDLVLEIGLSRIRDLDIEADAWLRSRQ